MPFIDILWGESPEPEDEPVRYEFDTFAEREAFCKGINESDGWMGFEAVDYDELPEEKTDVNEEGWWFFVKLRLQIGEYEKTSQHVLFAEDFEQAARQALANECHGEPDFEEGGDACWDMGEMRYRLDSICNLGRHEAEILRKHL